MEPTIKQALVPPLAVDGEGNALGYDAANYPYAAAANSLNVATGNWFC